MTLQLFKENVIDFAIINSYSERPNTAAINLQPKVTSEEKNRRLRKLSLTNNIRLLRDIFTKVKND
jgi:tRNA A37 methylthiotransferase MiaB